MSNGDGFDVWDEIENVQPPSRDYFGQMFIEEPWAAALVKGVGKEPYDPQKHDRPPVHVINMELVPLASSGLQFTVKREVIAQFKEWAGMVLPSIKALGISPRQLNGKYVHVELVKTGTYQKSGEMKDLTNFKFLAVYDTEAACEAAAAVKFGTGNGESAPEPEAVPANGNGANPEKATAALFLPALWKQAAGDVTTFMTLIAGNPLTSKHFTLNSPEVLALVAA